MKPSLFKNEKIDENSIDRIYEFSISIHSISNDDLLNGKESLDTAINNLFPNKV